MDYKLILVLLLIGHMGGDFYFQPPSMIERKYTETKIMIKHGLIYLAAIMPPLVIACAAPPAGWCLVLVIPLLHIVTDIAKALWLNKKPLFKEHPLRLFAVDQTLHLAIIAVTAYVCAVHLGFTGSSMSTGLNTVYTNLALGLPAQKLLRLISLLLFLGKPATVLLQKISANFAIKKQTGARLEQTGGWRIVTEDSYREAPPHLILNLPSSAIMGAAERYVASILVLVGQYSALGLIFAARTVTCWSNIRKNPATGAQYLNYALLNLLLAVGGAVLYIYIP